MGVVYQGLTLPTRHVTDVILFDLRIPHRYHYAPHTLPGDPLSPLCSVQPRLTIFFNWDVAARTGLGGFLDSFLGGLFPASLLCGSFVNSVGLGKADKRSLNSDLYYWD